MLCPHCGKELPEHLTQAMPQHMVSFPNAAAGCVPTVTSWIAYAAGPPQINTVCAAGAAQPGTVVTLKFP